MTNTLVRPSASSNPTVFRSFPVTVLGYRQRWKGPYMAFGSDPWGGKYYLTAKNLKPSSDNAAYVISAGQNQTIDTAFSPDVTSGALDAVKDDIIVRIK